jgi:hypothetical protein
MLVDENEYIWKKWQQPVFDSAESWGEVSASSVNQTEEMTYEPYLALDGNPDTMWKAEEYTDNVQLNWTFKNPLKIYRIELINGNSDSQDVTKDVAVYTDEEMSATAISGTFIREAQSLLILEPKEPFACNMISLAMTVYDKCVSLTEIRIIAEVGESKIPLSPYLNTIDGMKCLMSSYNNDTTYRLTGFSGFMFDGVNVTNIYLSSNHWLGFGTSSTQLKILNRDGCSTAIYRQADTMSNGMEFLKIRFEGYTVYNNRVESNRLIFELFLLGNNDMFLNVIQTPTSGNTGVSELKCNGKTTELFLADSTGQGKGTQVCFYHLDDEGLDWDIAYENYDNSEMYYFGAYLLKSDDVFYTIDEDALKCVEIDELTAAMFLKYGFEELPTSEILTALKSPHLYHWQAGGEKALIKCVTKAYPYPQIIRSVVDMSSISILGIESIETEYSGEVTVCYSYDNGENFTEPMLIDDFINIDPMELYDGLGDDKKLILHLILHDNATISKFQINYIN